MKHSLILAIALLVGLAGATTADAQSRRPSQRVVIQMKVDSWTPHEGAVGSLVTLNGSGFTRKMVVLVGGRKVRPVKMGSRALSFRMPANYGNGDIVVRKAGVANDYVVGRFDVWADPVVLGFAPASGTPGTRVEIRGRNFTPSDLVKLGNQSLRLESWSEGSLIVTIPDGAANAYLSVQNKRNAVSRSRHQFNVVAPAPFISDFSPAHGQPGTIVRITGGNLGNDVSVAYGRKPARITRTGNGWVEVVIPAGANKSKPFTISSRRGGAASAVRFTLELPPILGSYSPSWGTVGTRVTLNGRNFLASDRVSIAGQNCKILQLHGNQLTVEIPINARSGAFAVHRGAQVLKAATRFDVVYTPVVSGVSPLQGAPGTRVVLKGQHLVGARIFLGNLEMQPTSIRGQQIDFVIPNRALSGQLRVTSRGGSGSWATPFQVWNFPSVRTLSPRRGSVGTEITLTGTMLGNASQIFLGNVELPILSRPGKDRLVVTLPQGARTGPISWSAYGRNTATPLTFEVLQPPVVSRFTPTEGAVGTAVTILGSGFDRKTRVLYGGLPVRVLRWTSTQLSVAIPPKARKSDYLSVQGIGGGASAAKPFGLLVAPTLRSYSSYRAKPNTEITLWGTALAADTTVHIGGTNTRVLRVSTDGGLVVAVPALAPGNYDVSVQYRGLRSIGRKRFTVEGWAQVNDIRPRRAKVGQTIMLTGSGLKLARFWYGPHQLPIVKSGSRGRKVWVSIPEGCAGASPITVVDGPNKNLSPVSLEIEIPAPPPPPPTLKVRDHRKKKKNTKPKGPKVRDHRSRK